MPIWRWTSTSRGRHHGLLTIYAFGLPWLMATLRVGLAQGLPLGVTLLLLGNAIKVALAAGLLPATWRLVRRDRRSAGPAWSAAAATHVLRDSRLRLDGGADPQSAAGDDRRA